MINIYTLLFLLIHSTLCAHKYQVLHQKYPTMKKKMLYGQDVLVDTFPAHGATISHQLTYQKENMSMLPCYIQPSQIQFDIVDQYILNEQYQENNFEMNFIDGEFKGFMKKQVGMIKIDSFGVAILSNDGILSFIKINYVLTKLERQIQLKILVDQDVKMSYCSQYIHIIYKDQVISIRLNEELIQVGQTNVHNNNNQIINDILCYQNEIYVATDEGIKVHTPGNWKYVRQISDKKVNQLRIDGNGRIFYSQMGGIGIVGEDDFYIHFGGIISFDVSGNTLVTAFQYKDGYFGNDYHLDGKDWLKINTWAFNMEIRNVIVNPTFTFFSGNNGHYTIQHSILQDFYGEIGYKTTQHKTTQIAIHGLKQLEFYQANVMFGLTNNKIIFLYWDELPLELHCNLELEQNNMRKSIKLNLQFNSTQCSKKKDRNNDLQICTNEKDYHLLFVKVFLTTKQRVLIILMALVILLIILFCMIFIFKRYCAYRQVRTHIENKIDQLRPFENEQQPQEQQYMPHIQSGEKTPYMEVQK